VLHPKRYSEFSNLDNCIRHYFQTQDLLPPLPAKSVSFLVDHNDHLFLKARKEGLEQYLISLSKIPFIEHLPEYRRFLGYHHTYKELSYDLRSCLNFEQIFQLAPNSNKQQSTGGNSYGAGVSSVVNAYVCAELRIGDYLSKINGADTIGLPYTSKYMNMCVAVYIFIFIFIISYIFIALVFLFITPVCLFLPQVSFDYCPKPRSHC
jgi:hypothetical protein